MRPIAHAVIGILCACLPGMDAGDPPAGLFPAGKPFFTFADGFEGAVRLRDLFPADLSRWHQITLEPNRSDRKGLIDGFTDPATLAGRNHLVLSPAHPRAGRLALKTCAQPYNGTTASKADVSRTQLAFRKGDTVVSTVWYYIESGADLSDLFIWDLEAESADPRYAGQPGRRLYFQSGEVLASDLGKWLPAPPKFRQKPGEARAFPRDRWVRVDVRMLLSESADGTMEVWQDGALVIAGKGQTLPEAASVYTSLEVGITANGNVRHAHTVFVDEVEIRGWRATGAPDPSP
ncbi:MAG: polysaccharide lyase [Planctomycetes bacterium]|nr:polysaccharide lyase [Planctomycetota bacterium]